MLFKYIILIFLGLLIGFGFWKFIKHYNYELNYKESLIYSIPVLMLTILGLIDYSVIKQDLSLIFFITIISYFLLLLIFYYILRFIKLKKYIPFKSIIGYILISIINLVVLFNFPTNQLSNINGWDMVGIIVAYILFSIIYIAILLIINIIFLIIRLITKTNNNYNNIEYKISKLSYLNIFIIVLLLIFLIFMINYYNDYQYDKIIEKQKDIVIEYLNKEYPNYEFKIIDTKEMGLDCFMFGCSKQVFDNNILNKDFNRYFSIYVTKENLTIYEDKFQEIINEQIKDNEQ